LELAHGSVLAWWRPPARKDEPYESAESFWSRDLPYWLGPEAWLAGDPDDLRWVSGGQARRPLSVQGRVFTGLGSFSSRS